MKSWQLKSMLYCTWVGALLLLLVSPVSSAQSSSSTSFSPTSDCRLSLNPEECYYRQSQFQWNDYRPQRLIPATINSQSLGWEGPVSAEIKYEPDLSWILGLNYLQLFSERFGVMAKLALGVNELRANLTAGYQLAKDQQFKLTYEYLSQNLPFDFASGSVKQWVAQYSIGMAYQYTLHHDIVDSLELSGYITRAGSKELPVMAFNEQSLADGTGYLYDLNYRRIAGGNEDTILGSINLFPFTDQYTALTLGAGYSSVRYDTLYQNASDYNSRQGFAYKAELTHLLSPKTKLIAGVNASAASTEHKVEIDHILPHRVEASVKAQYTAGEVGLKNNSSILLGMRYPAPNNYALGGFSSLQELKNWIQKPLIYSARVLAIKDEKILRYQFTTGASMGEQTKYSGDMLTEVPTGAYFTFTDPSLQVNYAVVVWKISSALGADSHDYTQDLNLQLVSNGSNQAVLKSATSAGIPSTDSSGQTTIGVYQVVVTATATAKGLNPMVVSSDFKLTVNNEGPEWNSSVLPDANMGFTYPKQGDAEIDVSAKITLHGSDTSATVIMEDDASCVHPSWLVLASCGANPDNLCLSSNGALVPNTSNDPSLCVRLKATGNNTQLSATQSFIPAIIQSSPVWANPLPVQTLELNTDPATKYYLNSTYVTPVSADLVIAADAGFDEDHWVLGSDEGGYYLQLNTAASVPLAPGQQTVPVKASNATSYASVPAGLPFKLVDPSLTLMWLDNPLMQPIVGAVYKYNLNSTNPLLLTSNATGGAISDSYVFAGLSTSDPNWKVLEESGNYYLAYKGGTKAVPASLLDSTVTVVLSGRSVAAGSTVVPSNGNPAPNNTYTLTIGSGADQPPAFDPTLLKGGALPFTCTGDGTDNLCAAGINTGVDLTKMVVNATAFQPGSITAEWADDTAPPNWQIRSVDTNGGQHFILYRAKASNSTVSAFDVSLDPQIKVVPGSIKFCGTPLSGGEVMCTTTSASAGDSMAIEVNVQPDSKLRYVYSASVPTAAAYTLVAATSDGNGSPNPAGVLQPAGFNPMPPAGVCTEVNASQTACTVSVINDTDPSYVLHQGTPSQGYIHYNSGTISFLAPSTQEYGELLALSGSPTFGNNNYLYAKSLANGQPSVQPADGNVVNLPSVSADDLILVPDSRAGKVNQAGSYNSNNLENNVGVGINSGENGCSAISHFTVTALTFTLPALPSGKSYKLKQLTMKDPSRERPTAAVCAGALFPTTPSPYSACDNNSTYIANNIYTCSPTGGANIALSHVGSTYTFSGSYAIGEAGTYTLYVADNNLNLGTLEKSKSISLTLPIGYLPDLSTLASDYRAATLGVGNGSIPFTSYADFPVISVQ